METARAAMLKVGEKLSKARAKAAKQFGEAVTKEIRGLHMSAQVRVDITKGEPNAHGLDEVEFRLVQGGHDTALASSASGGELSRVMLALEVILAGKAARWSSTRSMPAWAVRPRWKLGGGWLGWLSTTR